MIEPLYPGVFQTTLENGLRILVEEVPQSRSVSVGVWVRCGSRDDPSHRPGLAHFIEHLVFKGTGRRTTAEISEAIDAVGGHMNAATGKESTCYYVDVPADGFSVAIDVLSDLTLNPTFEPEKIELERGVVLEEIRSHEDDPEAVAYDLFAGQLWQGGHPMSRPVLGERETVEQVTREEIVSHHAHYHVPTRCVVSVCGAVKADEVIEEIQRWFVFPTTDDSRGSPRHAPTMNAGRAHIERPTAQTHVYFGLPSIDSSHPDRFTLEVANSILGDGTSSRLFRAIREDRGLAYAVSSSLMLYSDSGYWLTYAGVAPESAELAADLIAAEFERLQQQPVDDAELALAKSRLRGHMILGMESNSSRMVRLGNAAISQRPVLSPDEVLGMVDAATPERLLHLTAQFTRSEDMNIRIIGPRVVT